MPASCTCFSRLSRSTLLRDEVGIIVSASGGNHIGYSAIDRNKARTEDYLRQRIRSAPGPAIRLPDDWQCQWGGPDDARDFIAAREVEHR